MALHRWHLPQPPEAEHPVHPPDGGVKVGTKLGVEGEGILLILVLSVSLRPPLNPVKGLGEAALELAPVDGEGVAKEVLLEPMEGKMARV